MPTPREPASLAIVRRFVHTLDVEEGVDAVADPAGLRRWLGEAGLLRSRARLTLEGEDLRGALELREALRVLLLANNGVAGNVDTARRVLEQAAERAGLALRFPPEGARLRPTAASADGTLGRMVAAVGEAMLVGTWPRLKACRAGDCTWAFWDGTRNRSRTWCSMAVCGNRTKARTYRRRRAAG
jgi:predicted RNA-binding Zn ribbon-like protein